MITVQSIIDAAVNTPPHTPEWAKAEAICELRGLQPYALVTHGRYAGTMMNITAVIAEAMLTASLQFGFRT